MEKWRREKGDEKKERDENRIWHKKMISLKVLILLLSTLVINASTVNFCSMRHPALSDYCIILDNEIFLTFSSSFPPFFPTSSSLYSLNWSRFSHRLDCILIDYVLFDSLLFFFLLLRGTYQHWNLKRNSRWPKLFHNATLQGLNEGEKRKKWS